MADVHTRNYGIVNGVGTNIDAHYGPWASIDAYQVFFDTLGMASIPAGVTIAVKDATTGAITKYVRENNSWRRDGGKVVDSLTSTSAEDALSAKQGKVLKDSLSVLENKKLVSFDETSVDVQEDGVDIEMGYGSLAIPAATTQKAGVMTAEQVQKLSQAQADIVAGAASAQAAQAALGQQIANEKSAREANVASINAAIAEGVGTTEAVLNPAISSSDPSTTNGATEAAIVDYVGEKVGEVKDVLYPKTSLTGTSRSGAILNTNGLLTSFQTGKYVVYDISNISGDSEIKVTTTANSEYVSLWALHTKEISVGETITVVAKGSLTSVKQEDTIDISQYPTAKYLYIGCIATTDTTTAAIDGVSLAEQVAEKADNGVVEQLSEDFDSLKGGIKYTETLQGSKVSGNLNVNGTITNAQNSYHYQFDINNYSQRKIKVTTTINNEYVTLWALYASLSDESPLAKGSTTNIKREDTVNIALYPTAKYLLVGSYTPDAVATATIDVDKIKDLEADVNALNSKVGNARKTVNIYTTDTELQILTKMISAYTEGMVDVVWEHGTYEFNSIYTYMRDTLKWHEAQTSRNKFGLPIGHNNRYYFNNSKLIANQPNNFTCVIDGTTIDLYVEVLTTRDIDGDFEIYDAELINNGGRYCVHDEVVTYGVYYKHTYNNIIMRLNIDTSRELQTQPFGCGTGFKASYIFDSCLFFSTNRATMAMHGAMANPDNKSQDINIVMKNCYLDYYNIHFNSTYFDKTRDNLFLYMNGCSFHENVDKTLFTVIEVNSEIHS